MSGKEVEQNSLFNIDLGLSEGESTTEPDRQPRGFQSEANFQQQRAEWKPKIEDGQLWRSLKLPIDNPSKPKSQATLHAVEELYFFQRYEEAMSVVERALKGRLIEEFKEVVEDYRGRCERKIGGR